MMFSNQRERRIHPRLSVEVEVQVQPVDVPDESSTPDSHLCVSRDVSESGMRIWAGRLYPVDARLLLTFECQEFGWCSITSRLGAVVWAEKLSVEGQCLLGIKFVDGLHPVRRTQ
jgi:hypothetical protein